MPFRLGAPELFIVFAIIIVIFGVGRLPEIGGAMGKAIRGFRNGISGKDEEATPGEAADSAPRHSK